MKKFFFIISIALFFFCINASAKEIGYISDHFLVTLRAGPGTNYKILALLGSGEPLKIISKKRNWTKVRPLNPKYKGKEGWILNRFIMKRRPYKSLVDELAKKNAQLKEQLQKLTNQLNEVTASHQAYQEIKQRYESLKKECSEVLSLKKKYSNNIKQLKEMKSKLEKIKKENEELKRSQAHRWFSMGAFVLFSGIVLGFILGRQKKRSSIYYS